MILVFLKVLIHVCRNWQAYLFIIMQFNSKNYNLANMHKQNIIRECIWAHTNCILVIIVECFYCHHITLTTWTILLRTVIYSVAIYLPCHYSIFEPLKFRNIQLCFFSLTKLYVYISCRETISNFKFKKCSPILCWKNYTEILKQN